MYQTPPYNSVSLGFWSTSTFLTLELTTLRNSESDEAPGLTTLRMICGELGYAVLLVISLIETIARGILCIPAVAITLIGDYQSAPSGENPVFFCARGTFLSFQNAGCCLSALVKNVTTKTLAYRDLKLCDIMWVTTAPAAEAPLN